MQTNTLFDIIMPPDGGQDLFIREDSMNELHMYRCPACGNLLCVKEDHDNVPCCCGQSMVKVTVNTADAGFEKHVPVLRRDGTRVSIDVGSVPHPMLERHRIEWICLLTDRGAYLRDLTVNEAPRAEFVIGPDEEVFSAYALCSLHGLWGLDTR